MTLDWLKKLLPKQATTGFEEVVEKASETMEELSQVVPGGIKETEVSDRLEDVLPYWAGLLIFLGPLLFLPVINDWFDLPKQTFLLSGGFLGVTLFLARAVIQKRLAIVTSIFDLPILLFIIVAIASAILADNKVIALSADPAMYAAAGLLFFLVVQVTSKEKIQQFFITTLLLSGAVLAIWNLLATLYTAVSALASFNIPNSLLLSPLFSPAGSPLSQAIFLLILWPLALGFYFSQKERIGPKLFLGLTTFGILTTVYNLYKTAPVLLAADIGWRVATGTLGQSLLSAFVGVGPAHFVDAFTAFKSLDFNASPFWNLRFTTSANFYFYLLTTLGILGLAAWLFLAGKVIRVVKMRFEAMIVGPWEKGVLGSLLLALLLFFFLPAPQVAIVAFMVVLALLVTSYRLGENTLYAKTVSGLFANTPWFGPLILLIFAGFTILSSYHFGRLVLADYYFAQSLEAARNNRGTDTYNLLIRAIGFNPWSDGYRVSYAQTNLALADAVASQKDLTDQQKQAVVQLVQQAIREGRNAVALEPKRVADWENLSLVYRNLINFAQGADQFAIASINQAIALDPGNPRLRLDLGGIYFSLKDYQSASLAFAAAANLKPDFANAHYNLAQAAKQLKISDQALRELQLTASLVCTAGAQSQDCQKVNSEIMDLGGRQTASPEAGLKAATSSAELATSSAKTNLPNVKTTPPPQISSPSGEIRQ